MNMAAYCRVSTEQEQQLDSLAHQKEFFVRYAQQVGHTLVGLYADAPVIIGLKPNPTKTGAALVLFSLFTGIFETFR